MEATAAAAAAVVEVVAVGVGVECRRDEVADVTKEFMMFWCLVLVVSCVWIKFCCLFVVRLNFSGKDFSSC